MYSLNQWQNEAKWRNFCRIHNWKKKQKTHLSSPTKQRQDDGRNFKKSTIEEMKWRWFHLSEDGRNGGNQHWNVSVEITSYVMSCAVGPVSSSMELLCSWSTVAALVFQEGDLSRHLPWLWSLFCPVWTKAVGCAITCCRDRHLDCSSSKSDTRCYNTAQA